MKRLLLIALIFTAPAFAQEETENEETQVEIRMESLGGSGAAVAVGGQGNDTIAISANADKSVWMFLNGFPTYCWVNEDNEPHCKEVKPA